MFEDSALPDRLWHLTHWVSGNRLKQCGLAPRLPWLSLPVLTAAVSPAASAEPPTAFAVLIEFLQQP